MEADQLSGKSATSMLIDPRFESPSDDSQPLIVLTNGAAKKPSLFHQNLEQYCRINPAKFNHSDSKFIEKPDKMNLKKIFHIGGDGGGGLYGGGGLPGGRHESFRWLLPRAPQHRLVYKNGECNITRENINKRGQRFLADIFTTLVDIKWRWNLLMFALAFALSWFIFGLIWWLISFSHGDLTNHDQPGWKACIEHIHDFPTALLFSIETQQTIGYGYRYMNPHCVEAIAVIMVQCILGMMIQALMTGLVFAKLSRPKKRAQTLMFSKSAVICERDSELCLLFRVGDMRRSHLVEAQIRALFISRRTTKEGEVIQHYQRDLILSNGMGEGRLFLVWPVILEHKIDETSPLWEVSGNDIQRRNFEIVVILEGIVESTGMTTQARTSYVPAEILWGHRFERLVRYQRESGQYVVDYSKFDNVLAVETSPMSGKERGVQSPSSSHTSLDSEEDLEQQNEETEYTCTVTQASDVTEPDKAGSSRNQPRHSLPNAAGTGLNINNNEQNSRSNLNRCDTAGSNRCETAPQSRRSSRTSRVSSLAALASFDLQKELPGIESYGSQINNLCQIQESV